MIKITLPSLKLNGEELQILNLIAEGGMGLTLGITFKKNPIKYPLIIGKLYKKYPDQIEKNLKYYKLLCENNLIPKLLDIQTSPSKYNYYCKTRHKKDYKICEYDNHIHYYEIAGVCTLKQFVGLSSLINYSNYLTIKQYIDITIEKAKLLTKLDIIHLDLHSGNIMIYNKNTLYLFDKFIMYNQMKDSDKFDQKQKDAFTKLMIDFLLNKNSIKGNTNKDLNKSSDKIKLSYDNKMDITIIDCDRIKNIKEIIRTYAVKYDKNDKVVNKIFELLYYSMLYMNVLKFLKSFIRHMNQFYKENENDKLMYLIKYCEKLLDKYCKEMYAKSQIYREIKNNNINFILYCLIFYGMFFIETQEHFDIFYEFIKNKKYIDYYKSEKDFKKLIYHTKRYIKNLLHIE